MPMFQYVFHPLDACRATTRHTHNHKSPAYGSGSERHGMFTSGNSALLPALSMHIIADNRFERYTGPSLSRCTHVFLSKRYACTSLRTRHREVKEYYKNFLFVLIFVLGSHRIKHMIHKRFENNFSEDEGMQASLAKKCQLD